MDYTGSSSIERRGDLKNGGEGRALDGDEKGEQWQLLRTSGVGDGDGEIQIWFCGLGFAAKQVSGGLAEWRRCGEAVRQGRCVCRRRWRRLGTG
ncbi:hypothetical protein M0R45_007227 [Rubus argutus]|uniref:Uncharacterized protein n=1 Tax=Rubus argutus TaxID=59490 RepID=A0AAW1Y116_RUBAR